MCILRFLLPGMAIAFSLSMASPSQAAYTARFIEGDGNVIATGVGSLDTASLTEVAFSSEPLVGADHGLQFDGMLGSSSLDGYYSTTGAFTGPSSFGNGGGVGPSSGSGDVVGIFGEAEEVYVPVGSMSGAGLSNTDIYLNASFDSMGLNIGTYVWSWGSDATADSYTLQVVPEPTTLALLAGPIALGMLRRRRASL